MTQPAIEDLRGTLPRNQANARRWLSRRALDAVTKVIIHWNGPPTSADELRQLRGDADYHIQKDWSDDGSGVFGWGIMYHLGVGQSGRIYLLNDLEDVLWHVRDGNPVSVGVICLLGKGQTPSASMLGSLRALVVWLVDERADLPNVGRTDVWGHGECGGMYGGGPNFRNNTECPGPDLLRWVRAYRTALPEPAPQPGPRTQYFPETGKTVLGGILDYFEAHGGLPEFGLPLTEEQPGNTWPFAALPELDGFTCQLFEHALLLWRSDTGVIRGRDGALTMELAKRVTP